MVRVWHGPGGEPVEQGARQVVAGKLRKVRSLTGHQRTFLQTHAPGPVKITLPSPSQFPAISFHMGLSDLFYPTRLSHSFGTAVGHCGDNQVRVSALLESGVDYIQVDAPRYSYYVDPRSRQRLRDLGEDPGLVFEEALSADNFCCRGNNQSKWCARGGYEAIEVKQLRSSHGPAW